jgi:hypothetical protein
LRNDNNIIIVALYIIELISFQYTYSLTRLKWNSADISVVLTAMEDDSLRDSFYDFFGKTERVENVSIKGKASAFIILS